MTMGIYAIGAAALLAPAAGGIEETALQLLGRRPRQGQPDVHGLFEGDGAGAEAEDRIDPDGVEVGDALTDPAGDGQAGDAPRLGPLCNPGGCLAEGGLGVDPALAGDDQVGPGELGVEPDQVEDQVRCVDQNLGKPVPPSATGALRTSTRGNACRTPCSMARAACIADMLPLNAFGATTIFKGVSPRSVNLDPHQHRRGLGHSDPNEARQGT
jgi:hypothetical protein